MSKGEDTIQIASAVLSVGVTIGQQLYQAIIFLYLCPFFYRTILTVHV